MRARAGAIAALVGSCRGGMPSDVARNPPAAWVRAAQACGTGHPNAVLRNAQRAGKVLRNAQRMGRRARANHVEIAPEGLSPSPNRSILAIQVACHPL